MVSSRWSPVSRRRVPVTTGLPAHGLYHLVPLVRRHVGRQPDQRPVAVLLACQQGRAKLAERTLEFHRIVGVGVKRVANVRL